MSAAAGICLFLIGVVTVAGCSGDRGGSANDADSPSGVIAYTSYQPDKLLDIYIMNADGTGKRPLIQGPDYEAAPAWSPDGTKIAFVMPGVTGEDVHIFEDGNTFNVTNHPAFYDQPTWSPDGRRIAFVSADRDDRPDDDTGGIYLIDEDGSHLQRLTHVEDDANPAWSPDGSRIAFERNSDLYTVNVEGGGLARLTGTEALEYSPAWSPDGRSIAFHRDSDPSFPESYGELNDEFEIWVMDVAGGERERRLLAAGQGPPGQAEPTWSPDGRWIAFRSHRVEDEGEQCQSIYVAAVDRSKLRKVTGCTRRWGAGHWIGSADTPSWGIDADR